MATALLSPPRLTSHPPTHPSNRPAILLDEPTSGLDATMALSVMRVLHQQAKAGRMVALTIHQPRAAIFGLFDDILVLAGGEGEKKERGGEVGAGVRACAGACRLCWLLA